MSYFDETTEKSHNIDYVLQFMHNVENPEWMIELVKNMRDENERLKQIIGGSDMKRIAEFEKVSFSEFCIRSEQKCSMKSCVDMRKAHEMESMSNHIPYKLADELFGFVSIPERKTSGSAGYDFVCPFEIELEPHGEVVIPTGIKCRIDEGWVLKVYPRSSLGFKYHVKFANTVGIIDSDYYNNSDNEGHILLDITNGDSPLHINRGDRFAQGIFVPFGITESDNASGVRVGGIGSTGK